MAYVAQHSRHHLESCLDQSPIDYIQNRFFLGADKEVRGRGPPDHPCDHHPSEPHEKAIKRLSTNMVPKNTKYRPRVRSQFAFEYVLTTTRE